MADAHSNVSQLRALLDDGEQPQSPTEVMINEHAPLRQTKLGKALDGMMAAYAEIIALAHQSMPVPPGPTPEHIKETSEVHVKQWRDSCLDMTAELTRIALQWEYTYPEQKYQEELEDIHRSIQRQEQLLDRARATMDKRTDEFFANPRD